jgi:peroxiredoxin
MLIDSAWSGLNVSLLGLVVLSQVGLWAVLFQVVKQQGRILLRLDELGGRDSMELPVLNGAAAPSGPKVGDRVTAFRLPSLAGQEVSLEDFRGKRVLLVHWSPTCGFCDLVAPDLAEHYTHLLARGVQLVIVSHGDPSANLRSVQEHGLACPVLIQPDSDWLDVFRHQGTPVACLVDAQARVERPLVVGANEIPHLVRELATTDAPQRRLPSQRPLSQSRIVRDGLKAGAEAPGFGLPDVHGGQVTLHDYRGRAVVLVFTDPNCGPCDSLAPHLARLSESCKARGTDLIMVSRGDPVQARLKADQFGLDFPVVVQQRWEISKAYGIFATPVAFLIDRHGLIARDVVQGADAVVALIRDQLEAHRELANGHALR